MDRHYQNDANNDQTRQKRTFNKNSSSHASVPATGTGSRTGNSSSRSRGASHSPYANGGEPTEVRRSRTQAARPGSTPRPTDADRQGMRDAEKLREQRRLQKQRAEDPHGYVRGTSTGTSRSPVSEILSETSERNGQNARREFRRTRPSGISVEGQSDGRPSRSDVRRSGGSPAPEAARTADRHSTFDLSYGEDAREEKQRKAPKEGNSTRPVVISAMLLAAVMLSVVIWVVTVKGGPGGTVSGSDSEIHYNIPNSVKIGGQKLRTDADYIEIIGKKVTDIRDLSYCFMVQSLFLSNNQIEDISPLKNCTVLQTLDLTSNQVKDITPLAGLKKLTDLKLADNRISDLSPLADMTQMEYLDISNNEIDYNFYSVQGMTSLRQLYASNDGISDISCVAGLVSLTSLELGGNDITDVSPLVNLTNLVSLGLSDNEIESVTALSTMTNLKMLDLSGNTAITNVEPLMSLTNLLDLKLNETGVSEKDVEALREALPNCSISR